MKYLALFLVVLAAWMVPCHGAEPTGDGWVNLFDGKTLNGWTSQDKKPVTRGWVVEEGVLHRAAKFGDIFTDREYANFVLEFEWKSAVNGNSGVKYRMTNYGKEYLGPEYQCFDDGEAQKPKEPARFLTASLYEIFAPNQKKKLNPPGQWNSGRIVADGSKIEHWLNGEMVVEADTTTDAYKKALAASKFAKYPTFGQNPSGRIMLQDHGSEVWFRNVRIKVLP